MENKKRNKNTLVIAIVAILLTIFFPSVGEQLFGGTDVADSNVPGSRLENEYVVEESYAATARGFRNENLLQEHYEKHGEEMGFPDAGSYEQAALKVVCNPDALHKIEAEDGDDVYYVEETNEFVIVSVDGYVRTYFYPKDGLEYFERQ